MTIESSFLSFDTLKLEKEKVNIFVHQKVGQGIALYLFS